MPKRYDPRVSRRDELSTRGWRTPKSDALESADGMGHNVALDMGWGRLLFGQTFTEHDDLIEMLRAEGPDQRDIALYPRDPHVLVARNPDELFIDPSLTFRLWMERYRPARQPTRGVVVRKMRTRSDGEATNRIYAANGMVVSDADVMWNNQLTETFTYLVAEDADTGDVIGTVTGVDHFKGWRDPESGSSLWCLAVHPQAQRPGVGQALVRTLAERYKARGRAYMDLSVMHDNAGAIALYGKLGFERVPVFCVKRKNPINEPLFTPRNAVADLNPYAKIVADEARRRGITVRVLDAEAGYLELSLGGREIVTHESLSELTTAIAMSRCDDKGVTRRVLEGAGIHVPPGRRVRDDRSDLDFLEQHGSVVVKPARGEQGEGVTVGITEAGPLREAIELARLRCPQVLMEAKVDGEDLRIIVIDHKVVAAAVRRPAEVRGTGQHTIAQLIEKQSRRRASATGGEARIPVDAHTEATVAEAGYDLDDVLGKDELLRVRQTANLHTGGTIHDVTDELHPDLARAAVEASRALDIPVVGLDFMVPAVDGPEYVCIEANERPGLANHEPRPTAQRFIDLLFPQTRSRKLA
jgi:GNAT-family acetyltransferase (TIGR03103 family)